MFDYSVRFDAPWYLVLLALVPLLWWWSFRRLEVLGPWRRWIALFLRTAVAVALVFALAEIQIVRTNDRMAVLYVVDQSFSIPAERRTELLEYVNASIREHRGPQDFAGVVVFGREAAIEVPPFDDAVQIGAAIESPVDGRYTNLAGAIRLASASFPPDAARRVVVVSDGAENIGDARTSGRQASEAGVAIDTFSVRYPRGSDVRIERLALPPDIRQDQPFDLRIVLEYTPAAGSDGAQEASGTLVVAERAGDSPRVISEERVTLRPGKQVYVVRQAIARPGAYSYEARFLPDDASGDSIPQNNRATAFAYVRGQPSVLLIENFEKPGQHDLLVERLRRNDLQVDVLSSDQLFTTLGELQAYDTVVLANVPREHFSERQIKMLVRNVQDLAAGLVMIGGEDSFGAGGWANTELEKAMPIDFQIKSAKVVPNGALAIIMHACELPQGNHWQKVVAREAIRTLGPNDYCGVLHWNMQEQWLWGGMRQVGRMRRQMLALIDRMQPGDMPDFGPTMDMASQGLSALPQASVKHMIIISDGDPAPPPGRVIRSLVNGKVTVSTVAIGTHGPADSQLMADIASDTGGKYYAVNNPQTLPRIFQREARQVARPLVYEDENGFRPLRRDSNELLDGIGDELPPITGYVMSTLKQNPLVEVPLVAPKPAGTENNTILANWQFGAGRTVAFTSDAGTRWTSAWAGWEGYDRLFSQMIRWSMRPSGGESDFLVTTQPQDGQTQVIVNALEADEEQINFLEPRLTVINPEMQPELIELEQVAPGRYVGSFESEEAGSYFLSLLPGADQAPIRSGVDIPYSAEFRQQATNQVLLENLASLAPSEKVEGIAVAPAEGQAGLEAFLTIDPYRRDLPPGERIRPAWPLALFVGGLLLFFDVLTRRVAIQIAIAVGLVASLWRRLRGRSTAAEERPHLEQLRRRKQEVSADLERRRAGMRFEVGGDAAPDVEEADVRRELEALSGEPPSPTKKLRPTEQPPEEAPAEESYTERLLKAKKKVWDQDQPGS